MADFQKVLSRLQNQCSKREYCRSDIFKKAMKAFEGDREASEKLLTSLVGDRFVDDLRYASAFAREKSRLSGWGPAKISFALSSKGIDRKTVTEALAEIDMADAARKMRSVLETKWKVLKDDPQGKFKLLRFGLSRGYEYDSLSPEVESLTKGTTE